MDPAHPTSGRLAGVARASGILFGIATHLAFGATVWKLFHFLSETPSGEWPGGMALDVLLALQFAIPHSLLLHRAVRKRLTWIPAPFYGCFYTVVTMFSLWLMFAFWSQHPTVLWQTSGWPAHTIQACFIGSWVVLFYSIRLTGLGWQTGWTPWWAWLRRQPQPRRQFREHGAYRILRHPVYLSFLGLLWFNPRVTLDRALLVGIWTTYIFVGSMLKDERLRFYLGQSYYEYERRVAGYPFIWFGRLGRRRHETAVAQHEVNTQPETNARKLAA